MVRPSLEYCSVAWMPFTFLQINKLEAVQKQFLLFALRDLQWRHEFLLLSYEDRLKLLNLTTLNERRILSCAVFMYKLLNGLINVPYLRNKLTLNQSSYDTRRRSYFMRDTYSTSYD